LFDYPAEGTRRARDRTAQPADPVPPAEHRSGKRGAQAASSPTDFV